MNLINVLLLLILPTLTFSTSISFCNLPENPAMYCGIDSKSLNKISSCTIPDPMDGPIHCGWKEIQSLPYRIPNKKEGDLIVLASKDLLVLRPISMELSTLWEGSTSLIDFIKL